MKTITLAVLLGIASVCAYADNVWDFAAAGSALGWKTNGDFAKCQPGPDGLVCETRGPDPQIAVAGLSIPANSRQFLEVEVKSERQETWQVFWANSTEGLFGGYEAEKSGFYTVLPGGFRKYHVYPFWSREGRMLQLRLDPPDGGGSRFVLKAVRVLEAPAVRNAARPAWTFNSAANGWSASSNVTVDSKGPSGWKLTTSGPRPLLLSPPLSSAADENLWVSLTLTASGGDSGTVYWATDSASGLHSVSFKLKADGQSHVYNIDMSGQSAWGGNIVALGFGPASATGATSVLKAISMGGERGGGPELSIVSLGLADPIVRAGKSTAIEVRVSNSGGAPTGPIRLRLARPPSVAVTGSLDAELPGLAPGAEGSHRWPAASTAVTSGTLTVEASAPACAPATAQAAFRWHPALPVGLSGAATYVPAPKPAPTGDYLVGCYYFPGWQTYDRWAVLDDFPERKPLLGYYREGDPEVADWHVKWALEHGISFFAFDWYWSAGGRSLDHALHNGFLKSRYFRDMKFCLLWANHNPPKTSSYADMEAVTRYWIDNYFRRPEYLRIGGKPVVIIFSANRFTEDMGVEGTRKALERSRELCRHAGLGGVYFIACTYPQQSVIKTLEQEGYDALSGYNYPSAGDGGNLVAPYEDNVRGYQEFWDQIYRASTIPYIPVADPGWDSRPWHGTSARIRTGKHPQLFAKMLQNARAFVDTPGRRLPAGKKVVLTEAWNEFGEGDYIEPTADFGFGNVDAIRDVFSTAPPEHFDIVPSDVGLGPYALERPQPTTSWDFEDPARQYSSQNMREVAVKDGALTGTSLNNDPAFYLGPCGIDARKYRCIEIRLRVSAGREAQLFWANTGNAFGEAKSTRFKLTADGAYHVYRVHLSALPRWSGVVRSLRLDMTDADNATVSLDYLRAVETCP